MENASKSAQWPTPLQPSALLCRSVNSESENTVVQATADVSERSVQKATFHVFSMDQSSLLFQKDHANGQNVEKTTPRNAAHGKEDASVKYARIPRRIANSKAKSSVDPSNKLVLGESPLNVELAFKNIAANMLANVSSVENVLLQRKFLANLLVLLSDVKWQNLANGPKLENTDKEDNVVLLYPNARDLDVPRVRNNANGSDGFMLPNKSRNADLANTVKLPERDVVFGRLDVTTRNAQPSINLVDGLEMQ
jgi:hypothetical protein